MNPTLVRMNEKVNAYCIHDLNLRSGLQTQYLVNQNTCNTNAQVLENLAKIERVVSKPKAILLLEIERIYTMMEYQHLA